MKDSPPLAPPLTWPWRETRGLQLLVVPYKTGGSGTILTKLISVAPWADPSRPPATVSERRRPMTTNIGDEESRIRTFKNNEDQPCPWLIASGRAVTSSKIGDQKLDPDVQPGGPARHLADTQPRRAGRCRDFAPFRSSV